MSQKKVRSLNFNITPECVYFAFQISEPDRDKWSFSVRYSELRSLNRILKKSDGIKRGELPSFPPKKLFGSNDPEFLKERQAGLENYMNGLLSSAKLSTNSTVTKFFSMKNSGSRTSSLGGSRKVSNAESTPSNSVKRSSTASDQKSTGKQEISSARPQLTPRDYNSLPGRSGNQQESKKESKQESKQEGRQESKQEGRQESKQEGRQESKQEFKQESKEVPRQYPYLLSQPERHSYEKDHIQTPKDNSIQTPKEGLARDSLPFEKQKDRFADSSRELNNTPKVFNSLNKERLQDPRTDKIGETEVFRPKKTSEEEPKFVLTKSGNLIDKGAEKEVENFRKKSNNLPIGNMDKNKKGKEKPLDDDSAYDFCRNIFSLCKR